MLLKMCSICHGEKGVSDEAAYSSIAGLPVKLQVDAMKAYRDGHRDQPPSMRRQTDKLTDADIGALVSFNASHR